MFRFKLFKKMKILFLILTSYIIILLTNNYFIKRGWLLNFNGQLHQKFIGNTKIPLTGGIFILLSSIYVFYDYNNYFYLVCIFVYFVGFCADKNLIVSPKKRFLFQMIIILIYVSLFKLQIGPTRVIFLDFFLHQIYLNILFTTFCLLILINGTNFIDGLNGLVLGYYSLVSLILYWLNLHELLILNENKLIFFFLILLLLLIFNLRNKLFLGDGGSYLIGFIVGNFLIEIHQLNKIISPFFIVLLLWYPCFENLFSIIRKFLIKKSPLKPDNSHLHQLLFKFIIDRFGLQKNYSNNLTSFVILMFNVITFLIGSTNIYNSRLHILLIIMNIVFYIVLYFKFYKASNLKL